MRWALLGWQVASKVLGEPGVCFSRFLHTAVVVWALPTILSLQTIGSLISSQLSCGSLPYSIASYATVAFRPSRRMKSALQIPGLQICCLPFSSQDLKVHSLMATAAKAALHLCIIPQVLLVCDNRSNRTSAVVGRKRAQGVTSSIK